MYKPISFFIGLRYLWNSHLPKFKKIITFLSIIGFSISIGSVIIIISIINGFEKNFKEKFLSFIPHLIITNKDQYINKSQFPKNILHLKNIEKFSDFINKEVIAISDKSKSIAEVIGIDIFNKDNVSNYNIKNILDILQPRKYHAIIGEKLSKKLNINIGDKLKIITISGKKNIFNEHQFKIIDIFSTKNEVDYYQILINRQDSLNFLNYSKEYITGWRIWLKNPFFLEINTIKKITNGLCVLDWKSKKGELFKAVKIEKYIMLFLFFLILIVAILNTVITLSIHTIEKKNTIAILKTLGLSQWKIMYIFVILGSSNAIIGNILGTVISVILILQNDYLKFFINIFFNNTDISIIVIPSQILFINVISTLLAIFSTLYPAWNVSKLKPARILSHE